MFSFNLFSDPGKYKYDPDAPLEVVFSTFEVRGFPEFKAVVSNVFLLLFFSFSLYYNRILREHAIVHFSTD